MQGIFLAARGFLGVLAVLLLWPVSAAHGDHGAGHPGRPDTTCAEVLDGKPGWELKQETKPAADSKVSAGQDIAVLMTWDDTDFADGPLYNALDCVTVDGRLETGLTLVEHDVPNDGEFTHNFAVPDGLLAGTEICSRGAIAGDGNGYFELNPSNDVCFTVAAGRTPPPEPPPPPTVCTPPPSDTPPTPPAGCTPPPSETPPRPPAAVPPPSPAVVPLPDLASPPDTDTEATQEGSVGEVPLGPAEGSVQAGALPRTGGPERTIAVAAGLLLAFGGAALIGAVKRPAARRVRARPRPPA